MMLSHHINLPLKLEGASLEVEFLTDSRESSEQSEDKQVKHILSASVGMSPPPSRVLLVTNSNVRSMLKIYVKREGSY